MTNLRCEGHCSALTVNAFTIERQEIRDLIDQSSDAINHRDWATLEAMMTDDVVWETIVPTPSRKPPGSARVSRRWRRR